MFLPNLKPMRLANDLDSSCCVKVPFCTVTFQWIIYKIDVVASNILIKHKTVSCNNQLHIDENESQHTVSWTVEDCFEGCHVFPPSSRVSKIWCSQRQECRMNSTVRVQIIECKCCKCDLRNLVWGSWSLEWLVHGSLGDSNVSLFIVFPLQIPCKDKNWPWTWIEMHRPLNYPSPPSSFHSTFNLVDRLLELIHWMNDITTWLTTHSICSTRTVFCLDLIGATCLSHYIDWLGIYPPRTGNCL